MLPGKYLAGGLQSDFAANSTGVQYKCTAESQKSSPHASRHLAFQYNRQALIPDGTLPYLQAPIVKKLDANISHTIIYPNTEQE